MKAGEERGQKKMNAANWNKRFFASTRGRIVAMLRRASRTVNELAEALDLTDNAVRAHLTTLERDGLVQQGGARRGVRKPHHSYDLTPEADQLFPKAYEPALSLLLDVLEERRGPIETTEMLREAGRRAAAVLAPDLRESPPEARLQKALEILEALGGLAESQEREGQRFIQGYSCPLAALVPRHPEVCRFAEQMLTELLGIPVKERCDRSEKPRCCFEVMQSHRRGAE